MGTGYTRQSLSDIQDGEDVLAAPLNDEFNAIQSAFDSSSGHSHDGTSGEGPQISLTAGISGILPIANGGFAGIHKTDATASPTNSDDTGSGYVVGSIWVDVTADEAWIALDVTAANAVWRKISQLAVLEDFEGLTPTNNFFITGNGTNWIAESASDARTSMGVVIGTDVQAYDDGLASIAGLTTSANQMIYATASDTYATTALTAAARTVLDDANISDMRTTLGVAIGSDVQAYDAGLLSIAGLTTSADKMIYTTALDTYATTDLTSVARDLLDDTTVAAQRTTLNVGGLGENNTWTGTTTFSDTVTINSTLDITGAFTSLGIDDNATGERLEVNDGDIRIGTSGSDYSIRRNVDDQRLILSGDSDTTTGANIFLSGVSQATDAKDIAMRSGTDVIYRWDDSQDQHEWSDLNGDENMTLGNTGVLNVVGDVTIGGTSVLQEDSNALRFIKQTVITSSDATWAFDSNTVMAEVYLLGGGGGAGYVIGSGTDQANSAAGGNSGGWLMKRIDVAALGGSPTTNITIGSGGSGGIASTTTDATAGGDTTYNDGTTSLTAPGGLASSSSSGGTSHVRIRVGAIQTTTTGGDINVNGVQSSICYMSGDRGDSSGVNQLVLGGKGADSPWGNGGNAVRTNGSSSANSNGNDATGYGSGGGGGYVMHTSSINRNGGDGTQGLCIIREYAL